MEHKNKTDNRAFQEMLQAAVKRLKGRSAEEIAVKSGAIFYSEENQLEVRSFDEKIKIQLPDFQINEKMEKLLQDKEPTEIQNACLRLGAESEDSAPFSYHSKVTACIISNHFQLRLTFLSEFL